jgi:hypothetical protein
MRRRSAVWDLGTSIMNLFDNTDFIFNCPYGSANASRVGRPQDYFAARRHRARPGARSGDTAHQSDPGYRQLRCRSTIAVRPATGGSARHGGNRFYLFIGQYETGRYSGRTSIIDRC